MLLSKLRIIIAVSIALVSLLVTTAFPQQGARDLFERARMLDESNQNLSEAIKEQSRRGVRGIRPGFSRELKSLRDGCEAIRKGETPQGCMRPFMF